MLEVRCAKTSAGAKLEVFKERPDRPFLPVHIKSIEGNTDFIVLCDERQWHGKNTDQKEEYGFFAHWYLIVFRIAKISKIIALLITLASCLPISKRL